MISLTAVMGLSQTVPVLANNTNEVDLIRQHCPDVQGDIVAKYKEGWHWIIGNNALQWGADKVWHVGYDNYIQCFCPRKLVGFEPDYHNGVQTVWVKASNLSAEKQQQLLQNGWLYWQNGADFGLAPEPYLAFNHKFDCKDGDCLKK